MRDGVRLFTSVYVPKDQSQTYPIMLSRTPYSVQPYGVDAYKSDLGPSPLFGNDGYIVVYQDVRGRWMSEGEFVNMRPHRTQERPAGHRREHRHLRHDRLADQERAQQQRPGGDVGDLLSGLLHGGRHDRRPPGAQGGVTPGAGDRLVHRRRLAPQRRVVLAARLQLPGVVRPSAPEPTKKEPAERFDYGTPDGYAFFLRMGPLSNANTLYFKDDVPFWNEIMQHGTTTSSGRRAICART